MFRKSSKTKQNIDEDEEQPYRWVDMFQFITRSNFDNESEDYTYLQIMFVLFNGGIINDEDSKPLYVSNSETYNKGLKILKNTQKNIQKVMPDNNHYIAILNAVIDILDRTDYLSYQPLLHIMILLSKIYDALVLTTAYTHYGISYPGYRYFNPKTGYLSNTLVNVQKKATKKLFGGQSDANDKDHIATTRVAVQFQNVMDYMDDHIDSEHITEYIQMENKEREKEDNRQRSEHILVKSEVLEELEKKLRLSFKKRFESFVKNDKHGIESVHFIDFVRKANIMKTDRSKFKIKKEKTLEKQSSGFRGLKKSKKTALNVLWGIKKKCSYPNCKGAFSKRKWVRNTFFNDVYCPTCMDKNLKKKTKKWKKKVGRMNKKRTKNNPEEEEEQHDDDDDDDDGLVDNNVNDVDPYKCNIEGGEDVYEFVFDGHLKTAYVIINNEDKIDDKKTIEKKEAKVEELKVEMDAILTKVAYIDDGKTKMVALRNVIKSANGILDKAFKKNHDWRKRLLLIDHFDGRVSNKGPFNNGDMVIYQNQNSHTYKEGMVLKRQKKVPARQQNSNEGSDKKLPKPLSYLDENGNLVEDKAAKYILLINGIETPVYSSRAVKNHHVTIFSYMRHFFKNDSIGNRISGAFSNFGEDDSDLHHVSRKQFCIELTKCLSMVDKLDWSQSCQEKYLSFVIETLIEVEKIYIVRLLSEELHSELKKRASQKITTHGLGTLAYVMTGEHKNFTDLNKYIKIADNDNDGYLSSSDFVRFGARPLLEQYVTDDGTVGDGLGNNVNAKGKKKNVSKTESAKINTSKNESVNTKPVMKGDTANIIGEEKTTDADVKKKDFKSEIEKVVTYDNFPILQKEIINRVRRLKGIHNPVSVTGVENNIEEIENHYVELSRVMLREDEVEEKILEYERKFDIHENMGKDEIANRRMMLYKRCETLNIMYGWCNPKYWEYDHDLELYAAMAEEQVRREHGEA